MTSPYAIRAMRAALHCFRLQLRDEMNQDGRWRKAWFMARCALVIYYPRCARRLMPAWRRAGVI